MKRLKEKVSDIEDLNISEINGYKVLFFDSVDSTNSLLKRMASEGAPDKTAIVAKSQTEGRGRLGRRYYSPDGTGIYMSVLVRNKVGSDVAVRYTTAAAVAVLYALRRFGCKAEIKWVNDIYLGGRKVCGILTESSFDKNGELDYAVIGIGINVFPPASGFPADITDKAGYLFDRFEDGVTSEIIKYILFELCELLEHPDDPSVISAYRSNSFLDGKTVEVSQGQIRYKATVNFIDDELHLNVTDTDGVRHTLSFGDVSIITQ